MLDLPGVDSGKGLRIEDSPASGYQSGLGCVSHDLGSHVIVRHIFQYD